MEVNGIAFTEPAARNPKSIPAIQEVHLAYASDINPHARDNFLNPQRPLYSTLDPEATLTVSLPSSPDESAAVFNALETAVERYEGVMGRLNTSEEWLDSTVTDYASAEPHSSEADARRWFEPIHSLDEDLAERADNVRQSLQDEPADERELPVRDVLLACGIGTDLELVDIHEGGRPVDTAALERGREKGLSEGVTDEERDALESLRGVCAYYGRFTQLTAQFEKDDFAEYDTYRVNPSKIVGRLSNSSVVLATEPLIGDENRGWGS